MLDYARSSEKGPIFRRVSRSPCLLFFSPAPAAILRTMPQQRPLAALSSFAAILFDLDGTLMDHATAAAVGAARWARELGLGFASAAAAARRWAELEGYWFQQFEAGRTTHAGQRVHRCRDYLGRPHLGEAETLELYEGYLAHYRASWRAFPDARPALERALATGAQVGVLTNGDAALQQHKLDVTGLGLPGITMLATVQLGATKPDPEAYRRALSVLGGVPAHRALMVGDNYANDVAAAQRAGLSACYLLRRDMSGTNGKGAAENLPEASAPVISSLAELC